MAALSIEEKATLPVLGLLRIAEPPCESNSETTQEAQPGASTGAQTSEDDAWAAQQQGHGGEKSSEPSAIFSVTTSEEMTQPSEGSTETEEWLKRQYPLFGYEPWNPGTENYDKKAECSSDSEIEGTINIISRYADKACDLIAKSRGNSPNPSRTRPHLPRRNSAPEMGPENGSLVDGSEPPGWLIDSCLVETELKIILGRRDYTVDDIATACEARWGPGTTSPTMSGREDSDRRPPPHRGADDDIQILSVTAATQQGSLRPITGHEETLYIGPERHRAGPEEWSSRDVEFRQPARDASVSEHYFFDQIIVLAVIVGAVYHCVLPLILLCWLPQEIRRVKFNTLLIEMDHNRPRMPIILRLHEDVYAPVARLVQHLRNFPECFGESYFRWFEGHHKPLEEEVLEGREVPRARREEPVRGQASGAGSPTGIRPKLGIG
eukprot:GHVU01163702.1.p1 GENE.GHVU01163702.1~~GHVU01163702.1.p1  ORF type:complete len:450 (+),score=32.36 GHVU01163702.1:40-1350(+)